MPRTRVVLAELPGLLRDIVKGAVAAQPDMEIVAEVADCAALAQVAEHSHPDVAVVGRVFSTTSEADGELLRRCASGGLALLSVTDDGRNAFSLQLRPELVALGHEGAGVSPQILVDAIRAEARRRGRGPAEAPAAGGAT